MDVELNTQIAALAGELEGASASRILAHALDLHARAGSPAEVAIAFSGAEDVLLLEYAHQLGKAVRVFSLDTGRLHPETIRFIDAVARHYGIDIEIAFPDTTAVESLVRKKGLFSFYADGHEECCGIRKVEPLRRVLAGLRGWITGQRRDQSAATRGAVPVVQIDPRFVGTDGTPLIKWNPLAAMTSADVWDAIRSFGVPFNELHSRGYVSIGCEPCTRALLPGQSEREGRWWWERADKKECGLHARVSPDGS